jgi:hypothetical protein
MNSKRIRFIWAAFLIPLAGCKEINGTISFKENESGILKIEVVYPKDSKANIDTCSQYFKEIKWNNIIHDEGNQCIYIYYFSNFEDVGKIHKSLNINLYKLTKNKEHFTYKANNESCIKKQDESKYAIPITWSLKPPGNVVSHNADKIIGNTLTWNISTLDCYNVFVESDFSQPEEKLISKKSSVPTENLSDNKKTANTNTNIINYPGTRDDEKPPDWTAISASIATIIATVIAYFTYRESKKKK